MARKTLPRSEPNSVAIRRRVRLQPDTEAHSSRLAAENEQLRALLLDHVQRLRIYTQFVQAHARLHETLAREREETQRLRAIVTDFGSRVA